MSYLGFALQNPFVPNKPNIALWDTFTHWNFRKSLEVTNNSSIYSSQLYCSRCESQNVLCSLAVKVSTRSLFTLPSTSTAHSTSLGDGQSHSKLLVGNSPKSCCKTWLHFSIAEGESWGDGVTSSLLCWPVWASKAVRLEMQPSKQPLCEELVKEREPFQDGLLIWKVKSHHLMLAL